jgi:hypothetical protein
MAMIWVTKATILTSMCSCNGLKNLATYGVAGSSDLRANSGRRESSISCIASPPTQSLFTYFSRFELGTTSPWYSHTSYTGINLNWQRSRLTLSLLRNILYSCRLQGHLTVPVNDKEKAWSTKSLVLATQSSEWRQFLLQPLYIHARSSTMLETVKVDHIIKTSFNFVKGIDPTSIGKDRAITLFSAATDDRRK